MEIQAAGMGFKVAYRCIGHGIGDAIRVDLIDCKRDEVVGLGVG